jgi:hypothetical protein
MQQYQSAHKATETHISNNAHVTCYSRFSLKILYIFAYFVRITFKIYRLILFNETQTTEACVNVN